ncbi:thiol:disulfide interchange protein DsbA/DsbL [Parasalinivibrio latis]|uniref:thioredoxin domain-containing protein n=1 Tax=Parasalinivibrio latis TaxID=2952610 RepID=UPI0030E461E9
MKIKSLLFAALATLTLSACSDNGKPTEGKEYTVIANPISAGKIAPVTEVFSLSCGHCRMMEDAIPAIEKGTSQDISKVHVTFNESAMFAALLYYSAAIQAEGKLDPALTAALFKYVQEEQTESPDKNKEIITALFEKYGLTSPYSLSEQQQQALFKAMEKADEVTEQAEIVSVPTFIVNGKYLVNTAEHDSVEKLISTLNFLLNTPPSK